MAQNMDLERIYDDPEFMPGSIEFDEHGNEFMFVKYNSGAGSVTGAAGRIVYRVTTGTTGAVPGEVTMDYDSNAAATAITAPNACAGMLMAALTDGKYGFVQRTGKNKKAMLTDGSVTAKCRLSISTTDGAVKILADAAPPLEQIGIAIADDSSTTLAAGAAVLDIRT